MGVIAIPEMVTAVAGAPTDIQYSLVRWTDSTDTIVALGADDLGMISVNLALFVTQVEGIDFPFFQRDTDLKVERTWLWDRPEQVLIESDFTAPLQALLDSAPSTEPLFNKELDTTAETAAQLWAADQAFWALAQDTYVSLFPAPMGQLTYADTVCRVLEEIQRHMLEPVIDDGQTWDLWTEDEVRGCINDRVCSFLLETGLTQERINMAVTAGTARPDLSQDIIEIRRVQWVDPTNGRITLLRSDEMQLDNYDMGWESTSGAPVAYVEQPTSTLQIKLSPVPSVDGTLHLIVVKRPVNLEGCSAFPIPAMFVPYIKYGVMEDMLLKEGEANDPERAAYCGKRFAEGIDLARALFGLED